ncbi:MAG: hypothetical protein M1826_002513 [Phylliscum demangeonii]|nr:MAG: hypothetical protein M1826_002513 [Phylliscum demangeonii]
MDHESPPSGPGQRQLPTDLSLDQAAVLRSASPRKKLRLIRAACETSDLEALVALALSPLGLVEDDGRRRAWPILLGQHDALRRSDVVCAEAKSRASGAPSSGAQPHRAEHQVRLDVDRSFIFYPSDLPSKELERRKEELARLINALLQRYPFLHYFQGFHDICQVFLLVLGLDEALACVPRLCLTRIRDFMLSSLTPALAQLTLLPDILRAEDPQLCLHLAHTQPYFALAATLTLYAHDVQGYKEIARLFDALLAQEPVFSLYLFATIIIGRRDELLEIPPEEPDMLYSILCKLPQHLDLDQLISSSIRLQAAHPPESLRAWRRISRYSVLKTARSAEQAARLSSDDGAALFQKQSVEMESLRRRQEVITALWRYRRPAAATGLAILMGMMAWWLRSNTRISTSLLQGHNVPLPSFLQPIVAFFAKGR